MGLSDGHLSFFLYNYNFYLIVQMKLMNLSQVSLQDNRLLKIVLAINKKPSLELQLVPVAGERVGEEPEVEERQRQLELQHPPPLPVALLLQPERQLSSC